MKELLGQKENLQGTCFAADSALFFAVVTCSVLFSRFLLIVCVLVAMETIHLGVHLLTSVQKTVLIYSTVEFCYNTYKR